MVGWSKAVTLPGLKVRFPTEQILCNLSFLSLCKVDLQKGVSLQTETVLCSLRHRWMSTFLFKIITFKSD